MRDPRQHVRPGDRLKIAASQINALNRMIRTDGATVGVPLEAFQQGLNLCLVRNDTGSDVNRWAVLAITGVAIDPSADSHQAASFGERPAVIGTTPTTTTAGKCVITAEPIRSGKLGRAFSAGVCPAKVEMSSASDRYAGPKASVSELKSGTAGPFEILWSESGTGSGKWAYVRFGGSVRNLRVGKYQPTGTSGAWLPQTTASVDIYEDGTPPGETTSSLTITGVVNHSVRVPYGSWVLIESAVNGYTYLVEAGTTGTCKLDIGGDDATAIGGYDENAIQVLGHSKLYPSGPTGPTGCVSLQWYTVTTCTGATG
jgi:hypothetical protein